MKIRYRDICWLISLLGSFQIANAAMLTTSATIRTIDYDRMPFFCREDESPCQKTVAGTSSAEAFFTQVSSSPDSPGAKDDRRVKSGASYGALSASHWIYGDAWEISAEATFADEILFTNGAGAGLLRLDVLFWHDFDLYDSEGLTGMDDFFIDFAGVKSAAPFFECQSMNWCTASDSYVARVDIPFIFGVPLQLKASLRLTGELEQLWQSSSAGARIQNAWVLRNAVSEDNPTYSTGSGASYNIGGADFLGQIPGGDPGAVPEPATFGLVGIACALAVVVQRRRLIQSEVVKEADLGPDLGCLHSGLLGDHEA